MTEQIDVLMTTREVHMIGNMVAVCWNTQEERRTLTGPDGATYEAAVQVRCAECLEQGKPYIDFVTIRHDESGFYEDEDSPIRGGISQETALQLMKELQDAIEYMKTA